MQLNKFVFEEYYLERYYCKMKNLKLLKAIGNAAALCMLSAFLICGCGGSSESGSGDDKTEASGEERQNAAEGSVIDSMKEEAQTAEIVEEAEVEDNFVPSEESQKNIEALLEQEKEKAEEREHLGDVLTQQDFKYDNASLNMSVVKDSESGKRNAVFKLTAGSGNDYEIIYSALNQFGTALLEEGYTTVIEVTNGKDTYKVDMKSASDITYASNVGGKKGTTKDSMPAVNKIDSYDEAQRAVYNKVVADAFVFFKLV